MMTINFRNIRNHDGSQNKGFEELVCQLAHLTPPRNADYFVRKEGNGGDGGVECFWKLKNGSEHAWQAKYFVDSLTSSNWGQISKSVTDALGKHPELTKYHIAIPKDRTNSRKTLKSGKDTKSELDKWNDYVTKWEKIAKDKNMNVEFVFWGASEIGEMIQVDDPEFSGRLLYWFNEPVINTEKLKKITEKSEKILGDRFTPEFHVELPIDEEFTFLGMVGHEERKLSEIQLKMVDVKDNLSYINKKIFEDIKMIDEIDKNLAVFRREYDNAINQGKFFDRLSDLQALNQKLLYEIEGCIGYTNGIIRNKSEKEADELRKSTLEYLYRISRKIQEVRDFLSSRSLLVGENRGMLLIGEAGIGKSHLLCDISKKRLEEGLPTLFILGQHYCGGDPIKFIASELDLTNITSNGELLGALDAFGESKRTRFLIIIDAINEGNNIGDWFNNIVKFIETIKEYQNIAIVISCRSTYKEYLVPEDYKGIVEIEHYGFKGYEHRAASIYLEKQGISRPGMPLLAPEFTNPLFLKTCCKAIKLSGDNAFPKGMDGFNKLYDFYIESVDKVVRKEKQYKKGENIVRKALDKFVEKLYPEFISGIPINDARIIIESEDIKLNNGDSLFEILINEGVLSQDIVRSKDINKKGIVVVRYTYERFSDYEIAMHIISKCETEEELEQLYRDGNEIGEIIDEKNRYRNAGIIEALSICIAEKFKKEFLEFVPNEKIGQYDEYWFLTETFENTILWRTGESITHKTKEFLNKLEGYGYNSKSLDIVLQVSTEPNHPWNADFLHNVLSNMTMVKRDKFWSTHIALNDIGEEEDGDESIVRTLIDWSLNAKLDDVDVERLRLISLVLIWITTTINRKLRDQATKSIVRVLCYIPDKIVEFLEKFKECDDLYLVERLYAAVMELLQALAIKEY